MSEIMNPPHQGAGATTMKLNVVAFEPMTDRIVRIHLAPADGHELAPAEPGAHIEIAVQIGESTVIHRAYSIVNADRADHAHYEIAVQREDHGAGGSLWMHGLAVGQVVDASPPKNNFHLIEDAQHHLLIAGGIGITPILAMARTLSRSGDSFQIDYAARDRSSTAYAEEVEAFGTGTCWFDGGQPGQGLVLSKLLSDYQPGHHAYVCGPKGLIAAVVNAAKEQGWPDTAVHYELFSGVLEKKGDRIFRLTVAGTGRTLEVQSDQTILSVLEDAGFDVLSDCRRGECGVCMTKVISGMLDHRDISLTPSERAAGKLICTCVSRCLSDELVIEL